MIRIREATLADIPFLTQSYNREILGGVATLDLAPWTEAEREDWFRARKMPYGVWILESTVEGTSEAAGWGSLSPFGGKAGYDCTAEISVYLEPRNQGSGHGRKFLESILPEGKRRGFHSLVARITDGNARSIRMFESQGFVRVGTLREAGKKHGRFVDVSFYQRIL
jgi:phosphinothricin acetyltransferase